MYEYKVVPAPVHAAKAKGLKSTAQRFSHALAECINAEAAGGWQFQRTESLTCEERSILGRVKTSVQTVMVFARPVGGLRPDAGAALAAAQEAEAPYQDDTSAYDDPGYDDPQYDAPRAETQRHATPLRAEPARRHVAPEPDPQPTPEPPPVRRPQPSRQEPLFRASPLNRPDMASRPEPILRPRASKSDDDAD
ncbi:hypothetical protein [Pararhodobacter sp.]|uniref:hypothetical protein n=1 Tax=Pararhodobacter sp. TaxID=2127056 RepID=UPI002AFED8B9|nr:hypothetical protein [Pararhodobacter sp.]